jgi:hypothetical protein
MPLTRVLPPAARARGCAAVSHRDDAGGYSGALLQASFRPSFR